ncbi:MAG: hypothetical protein HRT66_12030 [Flavobacteriaceae bacterium]|nr:hypothetical protein [Flavobacteriaceae bacterium]
MKVKNVLILIVTIITISVSAQKKDSIMGKWVFEDVYNKETLSRVC